MDKSELKKAKDYISTEIIESLPLTFRHLEFQPAGNHASNSVKLISVSSYNTTKFVCSQHHKPISKSIE